MFHCSCKNFIEKLQFSTQTDSNIQIVSFGKTACENVLNRMIHKIRVVAALKINIYKHKSKTNAQHWSIATKQNKWIEKYSKQSKRNVKTRWQTNLPGQCEKFTKRVVNWINFWIRAQHHSVWKQWITVLLNLHIRKADRNPIFSNLIRARLTLKCNKMC